MNIPTGPKPAWAASLQNAQSLTASFINSGKENVIAGSQRYFSLAGHDYAVVSLAAGNYAVIGEASYTIIDIEGELAEPSVNSDRLWHEYNQAWEQVYEAARAL